jgi:hypothetical protein
MFKVFHLDVAYIAMAIHVCFECFRFMLQVFHLNVAEVDLGVAYVIMTIHACFKCFICFRRKLQVFYFNISKVDLGEAHVTIAWCYCCVGHVSKVCFCCVGHRVA